MGVTWEDVAGMADGEVYDLLFPAQRAAREAYAEPDWEWVHSELQRDGVTLKLLWEELRDEAARDGMVAKGYNTFCRGYKSWVAARGVTNHLEHKPGQVMEVDWNGTPMWLRTAGSSDRSTDSKRPQFHMPPTGRARRADHACAPCRPLAGGRG